MDILSMESNIADKFFYFFFGFFIGGVYRELLLSIWKSSELITELIFGKEDGPNYDLSMSLRMV